GTGTPGRRAGRARPASAVLEGGPGRRAAPRPPREGPPEAGPPRAASRTGPPEEGAGAERRHRRREAAAASRSSAQRRRSAPPGETRRPPPAERFAPPARSVRNRSTRECRAGRWREALRWPARIRAGSRARLPRALSRSAPGNTRTQKEGSRGGDPPPGAPARRTLRGRRTPPSGERASIRRRARRPASWLLDGEKPQLAPVLREAEALGDEGAGHFEDEGARALG